MRCHEVRIIAIDSDDGSDYVEHKPRMSIQLTKFGLVCLLSISSPQLTSYQITSFLKIAQKLEEGFFPLWRIHIRASMSIQNTHYCLKGWCFGNSRRFVSYDPPFSATNCGISKTNNPNEESRTTIEYSPSQDAGSSPQGCPFRWMGDPKLWQTKCHCYWVGVTHLKINLEPKNHPFAKENHLNQTSIIVFKMLIFQSVCI